MNMNFLQRLTAIACLALSASLSRADSIMVEDDSGQEVTLSSPATRIIALAPHVVENLYSAGAGKNIVAAVAYSNFPEEAKNLPKVGSYNTFNVEAILSHQPDLVVAWRSGNKAAQIKQLRRLGIPVYVTDPRTLEDLADAVIALGKLTGNAEHAFKTASKYRQRLDILRKRYSHSKKVSAFYQVWNQPLQTLNGEHLVSDVLSLCGGENVFAKEASIAPKIGVESVIERNPDAIIASGMGESRPEWLDEWRAWPSLYAVKNEHLFFVPPDIVQRHSLRILQGAELICTQLESVRDQRRGTTLLLNSGIATEDTGASAD